MTLVSQIPNSKPAAMKTMGRATAIRCTGVRSIDTITGSLNPLKRRSPFSPGLYQLRSLQSSVPQPWIRLTSVHTFSTNSTSSKSSTSLSHLRSMVKPFLLKCHPDVHVSTEAKTINLTATQNLNSYFDTLQSIESADKFAFARNNIERIFEIDFVLLLDARPNMKKNERKNLSRNPSRRKVEIVLPPYQLCQDMADLTNRTSNSTSAEHNNSLSDYVRQRFHEHCRGELLKLMGVAGLTPSRSSAFESERGDANFKWDSVLRDSFMEEEDMEHDNDSTYQPRPPPSSEGFRRSHRVYQSHHRRATRPLSAYDKSRAQFTANIQWHNYESLYNQAVAEMNADAATEGLVERHSGRRRAMIAGILANVRLTPAATVDQSRDAMATDNLPNPPISFVEQLVAFRRLSLLLDESFAALHMEEFAAMWETCRIVLTPSRPYNVSSTALHKRLQRQQLAEPKNDAKSSSPQPGVASMTGFAFTLHPDWTVTIHIPIDFRDDELIRELDRNVWDFYNLLGDGTEALFPDSPA